MDSVYLGVFSDSTSFNESINISLRGGGGGGGG